MLYAEDALKQLRECFDGHEINYTLGNMNQRVVNLIADVSGTSISVWFDVDKQVFGFNMMNGGRKTYDTLEEFEDYFGTYVEIYNNFVPKAKLISNQYDEDFDSQTIYDTFVGNRESGYIALFRILNEENHQLRVRKTDTEGVFKATCVEFEDNGSNKYREIGIYRYRLQNGAAFILPTIDLYVDRIFKLLDDNDDISIVRKGIEVFEFNINDFVISATVTIDDESIIYNIESINGEEVETSISLNNPYDIMELYNFCVGYLEAKDEVKEENNIEKEDVEDMNDLGDEVSDELEDLDNTEGEEDINEDEYESGVDDEEDSYIENEFDSDDSLDNNEQEEIDVPESNNEEITSLVLKVYKEDDIITAVHFITGSELYSVSVDVLKKFHFPYNRIKEEVKLTKGVLSITEDEKRLHKFVVDVSDDEDMVNTLLEFVFE